MRASRVLSALALVVFLGLIAGGAASEQDHEYSRGDDVFVWVNKVGPRSNPQETYPFYSLYTACAPPDNVVGRTRSLGELIEGDAVIRSHMVLQFRRNMPSTVMCTFPPLTDQDVERFSVALSERYMFELFVDEMPVWGQVGTTEGVYTLMHFQLLYNDDRIVGVNVTCSKPVKPVVGKPLAFRVSATWYPSTVPFSRRFDRYLEPMFFEHRVHWFALANGVLMAAFLLGVVYLLLTRSSRTASGRGDDEALVAADDEAGWKRLAGEIYRPPAYAGLLSALVGIGAQLFVLALLVVLVAVLFELHTVRGGVTNTLIGCYVVTAAVAGLASGALYRRYNGPRWIRTAVLAGTLLPLSAAAVALPVSVVAWAKGSLTAIPFGAMLAVLALWLFLALPLTFAGTIIGRNFFGVTEARRVAPLPRAVPQVPWYLHRYTLALAGGLLPFVAAFLETYFVFAGLWHYKLYYVYGFAGMALVCVVVVAACSAVVVVFAQLSNEDHYWPWTAFCAGGAVSVYIFAYSVHYFLVRTTMSGLLQTLLFFGYSALLSCLVGVVCGTMAFFAVSLFLRRLYFGIKSD